MIEKITEKGRYYEKEKGSWHLTDYVSFITIFDWLTIIFLKL